MPAADTTRRECRLTLDVAIIDFGLGNLFSVQQACAAVGLDAQLTSTAHGVEHAAAVIVPGVGAFGDAMAALRATELDVALRDASDGGKLVIGICLGMQLLFSESEEFGAQRGLGIFEGKVLRLPSGMTSASGTAAKVPAIGWNAVRAARAWHGTPLDGVADAEPFYFVHSYYARPADQGCVLSTTTYGTTTYCSSVARGNTFGFQFHPERSATAGLRFYSNLRRMIEERLHAALEHG